MGLLFDDDYIILEDSGLTIEEDINSRFLVIKNYPLKEGLYQSNGQSLKEIEVLLIIPSNYNTSGGDMFWTYPKISRIDGVEIPAYGGDPRIYNEKTYDRWSRHWQPQTWIPKKDNIVKLLSRVEWALQNPNANR
ncbi:MAG: hypothetical protein C0397_09920 [Odoribacter sp.]|nr:hypothetical protein [Odoribacter sp.]